MTIAVIIDKNLPYGLIANTASVLGISLGALFPSIVRESAFDAAGLEHPGITSLVIPVLAADEAKIGEIARSAGKEPDLTLVPFNKVAQGSNDYDEYKEALLKVMPEDLTFSGLALIGPRNIVRTYTGSLPLLK